MPPASSKQLVAEPSEPWGARPHLGGILLIALVAVAIYLPALRGGFVWDDDQLLVNNPLVKAPDGLYRMWFTLEPVDYWPMTYSTFWLEWRLWGAHPAGYHATNLLLHVGAAVLLWWILLRLRIPGAFLAALVFAVHPMNVESVAWIAQRKNTLAIVFFLLSILWFVYAEQVQDKNGDARRYGWGWYWLSLLSFVLAMLAKGSVAILPVVLLAIVWWQRRRISQADVLRSVPFFLVAMVLTAVNVWFQTHGTREAIRVATWPQRLAGAGGALWFYLAKAIAPLKLIFVYPQWQIEAAWLLWWLPLVAAVVVSALLCWRVWLTNSNWARGLWLAWLLFGTALVPVLGLTDVYFMKYSLVADHYAYLALLVVAATAAAGWTIWQRSASGAGQMSASALAVMVVAGLSVLTWQQSRAYSDIVTLYETTLAENPSCWMAHNNLGLELVKLGRAKDAEAHYRQALALHPDYPEAHNNLGIVLRNEGRLTEAIPEFHEALRLNPKYIEAHSNLGVALVKSGQMPEAIEEFSQAVRMKPDYAEGYNNLGAALHDAGHDQEAIVNLQRAVTLRPGYADGHVNLAISLAAVGRIDEALAEFALATKAYAAEGRAAEAIGTAQKALELARSQGQNEIAKQIEAWLNHYRSGLDGKN